MSYQSDIIKTDIEAYLEQHERKELLRFLTCGSVDDGKSTLIGRLLYDSQVLYHDQLDVIQKKTVNSSIDNNNFNFALITDGLRAEREQGITIDVAYRYFSTSNRKFIIADTPGHEQYTRNMVTGASGCDLAIILIDARHGVVTQTRRHILITSLLGIRHFVVAVNKMDLIDFSQSTFNKIQSQFANFVAKLDTNDIHYIPLSALKGDNVVELSQNMPWYRGTTLMHYLENIHIASDRNLIDLRFPVQYVNRPNQDFRGYCGSIASGILRPGDDIMVLPSRQISQIKSIITYDDLLSEAHVPLAITVTTTDNIDISRGDLLVHPENQPQVSTHIEAMVVWMDEKAMILDKRYLIKHMTRNIHGVIEKIHYRIDVNTLRRQEATTLYLNEIGRCSFHFNQPLFYDPYQLNCTTGAFIIIDMVTNNTVGAGIILIRGVNHKQKLDLEESVTNNQPLLPINERADNTELSLSRKPMAILIAGPDNIDIRAIAYALERKLSTLGQICSFLDRKNLYSGINQDLRLTEENHFEAIRRTAEVAKLMNKAGLTCLFDYDILIQDDYDRIRKIIGANRLLIVHIVKNSHLTSKSDKAQNNFSKSSITKGKKRSLDIYLNASKLDMETCASEIFSLLQKITD